MAPLFNKTFVYEPAILMRYRLSQNLPHLRHYSFDTVPSEKLVVSIFNVLDVIENPKSLISQVLKLNPTYLIVSIPSKDPKVLEKYEFGTLEKWASLKYYDLDDHDYLDCIIAIYKL